MLISNAHVGALLFFPPRGRNLSSSMPLSNIDGIFNDPPQAYCTNSFDIRVTSHRTSGHSFLPVYVHLSHDWRLFLYFARLERQPRRAILNCREQPLDAHFNDFFAERSDGDAWKTRKPSRHRNTRTPRADSIAGNERPRFSRASTLFFLKRNIVETPSHSRIPIVSDGNPRLHRSRGIFFLPSRFGYSGRG